MQRILAGHTHGGPQKNEIQPLIEHCRIVGDLCGNHCKALGLFHVGRLTGWLHDVGKSDPHAQDHYYDNTSDKVDHASAGMRWVLEAAQAAGPDVITILTAQMIALAVGYHHSELPDILPLRPNDRCWLDRIHTASIKDQYAETCRIFFQECIPEKKLLEEFKSAVEEVRSLHSRLIRSEPKLASDSAHFFLGLVQRFLFSALVDADWADTARFMDGLPESTLSSPIPDWEFWAGRAEEFFSKLSPRHPIDALRQEISAQCAAAGQAAESGIVRLYVPTGGGKTYSGLRYCLQAAKKRHASRIFYFAPFRSIIGQNTKEFAKVLGDSSCILEHHSDAVLDTDNEELLMQLQRWQGPVLISTTMVQFLNTLFAAPRQNVRRLCALANSVLLFDEIQSLPLNHLYLFNSAVNFLSECLHCTVVLCTATQPEYDVLQYPVRFSFPRDLVPNYQQHFDQLRRTHIVLPDSQIEYNESSITDFVLDKLPTNRSILVILNTRHAVEAVFSKLTDVCPKNSRLFCLTTHLCAQHRSDLIKELQHRLADETDPAPIICISTQLIEAGVDLSFDCVIRSMAGLPSIAQAAGRCNRHGENGSRPVYLLSVSEHLENLDSLPEIRNGKLTTKRLLHRLSPHEDLLSPTSIQAYYRLYYKESSQKEEMADPVIIKDCLFSQRFTLLDLLSLNEELSSTYICDGHTIPESCVLRQSFHTAQSNFKALDSSTIPIIVPYQGGADIVLEFSSCQKPSSNLLKSAQPYLVNITDYERKILEQNHALYPAANGTVMILHKGFYDDTRGLTLCPKPLLPLFS